MWVGSPHKFLRGLIFYFRSGGVQALGVRELMWKADIFFFVQAYKLSAYAHKLNKLGRNHNATPSTLSVLYFLLVGSEYLANSGN